MSTANITLNIPENIYQRLVNTAKATKRPLEDILLQAITVGSPPALDDIPEEYRTELADLEQLDDQSLWQIATQKKAKYDLELYDILLDKKKSSLLTETEQLELTRLHYECDLFILRKLRSCTSTKILNMVRENNQFYIRKDQFLLCYSSILNSQFSILNSEKLIFN